MIVADGYIRGIQIIYRRVKGRGPSRDPGYIGQRLIKVYEDFVSTAVAGEVPHFYIH